MGNNRKIIVVGAGIAGLTLCCRLSAAGYSPVLIEKERSVGGLARSYTYDDGYTFDIGPHRFYTEVPDVLAFIHDILGDDFLTIGRKSSVKMFDRIFEWPLDRSSLLKMPLKTFLAIALDFLRGEKREGDSFEAYIINSYGRTLYEIFFKPYTEKFLGLPCNQISKHWAVTGIDRAVIDNSVKVNNLLSLAKSVFSPRPPLDFIYPASGGNGVFTDKMQEKIIEQGGTVLLDAEVTGIVTNGTGEVTKVLVGERELSCDLLVWSAPVNELAMLLGTPPPNLKYLSLILYNYTVERDIDPGYQWCYFGAEDVPFNRVSFPAMFNRRLVPPGGTGVCVEVTCRKGDGMWQNPEEHDAAIRKAMIANGILDAHDTISACHIERVSNAYPVYALDYAEQFSQATAEIDAFTGLELLGRTGEFWYNNMDHSIEAALALADKIIARK